MIRQWVRRGLRFGAIFFSGVLAHEALESPPPTLPPQIHAHPEKLSPAERRYMERLRATLADLERRWPHILPHYTIDASGHVTVQSKSPTQEPATVSAERNREKIVLKIDRSGAFAFLRESQGNITLELWPAQHDLRQTTTSPEKTEYLWTTKADLLFGQRSRDGKLQSLSMEGEGAIDPKAPPAVLREKLTTPHRAFLFQQVFATYHDYTFGDGTTFDPVIFAKFLRNFRLSLAEWQSDGYTKGACNTYAETACELLAGKHQMHLLTFWPKGNNKFHEWHQAAGFPLKDGNTWCIIDGSMERLEYTTPEAYARSIDMEIATSPVVGRLAWQPERRGPFFRFLQHVNIPEKKRK